MKKKLVAILSIAAFIIEFGPLFLLSWVMGFLASKLIAGKSLGERGKFKSIIIPFRKWGIHLHHWLYSLFLIILSLITNTHFLSPEITYGILGGLVFQGIYCYGDWHVILISRHRLVTGEHSVKPGSKDNRM